MDHYLHAFEQIIENEVMSFKEKRKAFMKIYEANPIGKEAVEAYIKLEYDLRENEVGAEALDVGDKVLNFSLEDAFGKVRTLEDCHQSPWLIINFFRGQFCPFCNLELKTLQDKLDSIQDCPADLVAISPQKVKPSRDTVYRNKLTYTVLSDPETIIGSLFGVSFIAPDYMKDFHLKTGVPRDYLDEKNQLRLFIPATYIIDRQKVIRYRFLELNPAKRMDPDEIVFFIKNQS
jgi:peroxiredoxin